MNAVACVNFIVPNCDYISYFDDQSLRDFDIIIFSPKFPPMERVYFDAGGSCLAIEETQRLSRAMLHWKQELREALAAGKTVFLIADSATDELAAISVESKRKGERNYQTQNINNYQVVPISLKARSAKGRVIRSPSALFKGLLRILDDLLEYRVVFEQKFSKGAEICAKDGTPIGGVLRLKELPGTLVALPYFDFSDDQMVAEDEDDEPIWSDEAERISKALLGQITAISKEVRESAEKTPPPDWVQSERVPQVVSSIRSKISELEAQIADAEAKLEEQRELESKAIEVQGLLYEKGQALEMAIEKALILLGFEVETIRIDDLEIDHVIVSPEGKRMIGESEGKDNSAIDIKKFRQLESNIGEDFERDEIDEPAKGVLFGNGYRFLEPDKRPDQFTRKSLTNAARLGSALVKTSDLYPLAVYLMDNPDNELFKKSCRDAICATSGGLVVFPSIP